MQSELEWASQRTPSNPDGVPAGLPAQRQQPMTRSRSRNPDPRQRGLTPHT